MTIYLKIPKGNWQQEKCTPSELANGAPPPHRRVDGGELVHEAVDRRRHRRDLAPDTTPLPESVKNRNACCGLRDGS